jgi:hypothetical protein
VRCPTAIGLLVLAAGIARGDASPAARQAELRAAEVKALVPVLRAAVKEDHRRQAWYLAWRISAAQADHEEARLAMQKWRENERLVGTTPAKAFLTKRDAALRSLGDGYAQLARVMQGEGAKTVDTFFALERALAYGSKAADLLAALDAAGYEWAGSWGTQTKEAMQPVFGAIRRPVSFPPEWDSALLAARAIGWGDARVISVSGRRIVMQGDIPAAGRRATLVTAMEAFLISKMGSTWKESKVERDEADLPTFFVCPDADLYARLAEGFAGPDGFPEADKADLAKSSGWPSWWVDRVVLTEKHRDASFTGVDANFCGWLGQSLARRHLAVVGGRLTGRGCWIVDALGGLFEGFQAKGPTDGTIDPARIRHLAVARGLKAKGALLPWDELLEVDREAQRNRTRQEVKIRYGGEDLVAKEVDVVVAQGTALAYAIWTSPDGKGPKRLANLVAETLRRDRMPDLDKSLGIPKARVEKEADAFLSAPAK